MAHFAQGKYNLKNPSKYVGTKSPTYRSGWEFTFMKFCDEHRAISQWASEAVKIPYRNPLTINVCQYYAKRIPKQYGNYGSKHLVPPEHRITAYCKPTYVDPNSVNIYDY